MVIVRGQRIVLPEGERPASIHIDNGIIAAIGGADDRPAGAEIVDCGSLVVSPGIVDSHVHINEPGRADWEGFDTATRAAGAGGASSSNGDLPASRRAASTCARGGSSRKTTRAWSAARISASACTGRRRVSISR